MEIVFPDYENSGLNVVSAVINHLGFKDDHPQQRDVKMLLEKGKYKKVVLMLFDGMGMDILEKALPENSFLRSHLLTEISAAYPSTTTNATSSIECCLYPGEHAWLGWTLYFREIDKLVDVFINRDENGEEAAPYPVGETYNPRKMIFSRLQEAGIGANCVSRFGTDRISTLEEMRETVLKLVSGSEKRYVYCYWGDPDHTMHELGCYDERVIKIVQDIDAYVKELSQPLPEDTLLMVTADHGLIDGRIMYVEDMPLLRDMLIRMPAVEPRAAAFYVKKECLQAFPEMFRHYFGENFLLMTAREFVERGYLGPCCENPRVWEFLGDYVALSTGQECIMGKRGNGELIGVHAGLTKQEMRVPLIAVSR